MVSQKHICVLGAGSFLGQAIVKQALEKGYRVTGLCRNPYKLNLEDKLLNLVEADYFNKTELKATTADADVVISCIGPPQKGRISKGLESSYVDTMGYLITLLKENNQRFLHFSGAAIKQKGEKLPMGRKSLRFMMRITARPLVRIKEKELALLSAEPQLNWTSFRPAIVEKGIPGKFDAADGKFIAVKTDLDQLLDFCFKQINSKKWLRKAPTLGTKPH